MIGYLFSTYSHIECGYEEEKTIALKSFFRIIHTQAKKLFKVFLKIRQKYRLKAIK